jgi:copper chaperone CopZ
MVLRSHHLFERSVFGKESKMKIKWLYLSMVLIIATGCATTDQTVAKSQASGVNLTTQREVVLTAYGLSCPLCANNLDAQLAKVGGVEDASIDLSTGTVVVRLQEGHSVTHEQLAGAVDDAGFTLKDIQSNSSTQ